MLPVLNIGSVFGRFIPGYFADRYGRFNIVILATILTVFAVIAIWLLFRHTTRELIIFALLFGLSSGSNISPRRCASGNSVQSNNMEGITALASVLSPLDVSLESLSRYGSRYGQG